MKRTHRDDPAACWSTYWAGGALTSLPDDFRANYDGEIESFWADHSQRLQEGARVLDVCTGNGAVALLLARLARQRRQRWSITAVDAARIRPEQIRQRFPEWSAEVDDVRFVGGRRLEELAVEGASIDLITSQYGIEYCDWRTAAGQCHHMLKPGGQLVMLCHSVDSDMLERMRAEREEYRQLDDLGVVAELSDWLAAGARDAEVRGRLRRSRRALTALPQWPASAVYQYVHGLLGQVLAMPVAQLMQHKQAVIDALWQLEAGGRRLGQMLAVNQAMQDHPDWTAVFVDAGLKRVDAGALIYRGTHRVGEWFVFERSAG